MSGKTQSVISTVPSLNKIKFSKSFSKKLYPIESTDQLKRSDTFQSELRTDLLPRIDDKKKSYAKLYSIKKEKQLEDEAINNTNNNSNRKENNNKLPLFLKPKLDKVNLADGRSNQIKNKNSNKKPIAGLDLIGKKSENIHVKVDNSTATIVKKTVTHKRNNDFIRPYIVSETPIKKRPTVKKSFNIPSPSLNVKNYDPFTRKLAANGPNEKKFISNSNNKLKQQQQQQKNNANDYVNDGYYENDYDDDDDDDEYVYVLRRDELNPKKDDDVRSLRSSEEDFLPNKRKAAPHAIAKYSRSFRHDTSTDANNNKRNLELANEEIFSLRNQVKSLQDENKYIYHKLKQLESNLNEQREVAAAASLLSSIQFMSPRSPSSSDDFKRAQPRPNPQNLAQQNQQPNKMHSSKLDKEREENDDEFELTPTPKLVEHESNNKASRRQSNDDELNARLSRQSNMASVDSTRTPLRISTIDSFKGYPRSPSPTLNNKRQSVLRPPMLLMEPKQAATDEPSNGRGTFVLNQKADTDRSGKSTYIYTDNSLNEIALMKAGIQSRLDKRSLSQNQNRLNSFYMRSNNKGKAFERLYDDTPNVKRPIYF